MFLRKVEWLEYNAPSMEGHIMRGMLYPRTVYYIFLRNLGLDILSASELANDIGVQGDASGEC